MHLRPGAGAAGARVEISFSPPPPNGFPSDRAVAVGAPLQPYEGFYAQSVNIVSRHAGTLEESGDGDSAARRHEVEHLEKVDDREKIEKVEEEERETWSRHGRWRVPVFLKRGGVGGGDKVDSLPPLALEVYEGGGGGAMSVDVIRWLKRVTG